MIQFTCSNCGKHYNVKDDYQGRRVRCKSCGTINQISASSGKKGSGDSLAALNKLLVALSDDEKTAPELELDD